MRTLATRFSVAAAAGVLAWNVVAAATDPTPASASAHPAVPAHAAASAPAAGANAGANTPESGPPGTAKNWGMLKGYCEKCHNAEDWAGSIAFDTMTPGDISNDAETWEKAIVKLRGRLMPPPGNKQPSPDQIHSFVHWMEGTLDKDSESHPVDPGRVALHRLNRKEYANAIWDLLAVKVDP